MAHQPVAGLEGATKPTIHAETFSWTQVLGNPALSIEVPPLFRGFE